MSFKIGFTAEKENVNTNQNIELNQALKKAREIKKSLVRVHFPDRNLTCTYYNDMFNLKRGDIVYVDGKLEGLRGRVVDVSYSFKIKVSDYKKVIGLAETDVMGKFHFAGSHFITLDRIALPYAQAITWFKAPTTEEEEYLRLTIYLRNLQLNIGLEKTMLIVILIQSTILYEAIKKYKLASSEGINKYQNRMIRYEQLFKSCIVSDDEIIETMDRMIELLQAEKEKSPTSDDEIIFVDDNE